MEHQELEEKVIEKPSLIGMIMNPREQFERIRENPKIIVALLVVTFLTIVGLLMMVSAMDFIENDPALAGMSEEELLIVSIIGQITFVVIGIFTPVVMISITAIIIFILAKIVRSDVSFKQLFSLGTYAYFISVLGFLLNGLVMMILKTGDPETLFTSLNSVVNAQGVLGALLSNFEVFNIWYLVVLAIGLQVVAKFSKGLSWSIVIAFFIIGAVFSMAGAAAGSVLGV